MRDFRVFIYADGLVLPLVVPVSCTAHALDDRLRRIFAHDLVASRAEVWDGLMMILQIDAAAIAALVRLTENNSPDALDWPSVH